MGMKMDRRQDLTTIVPDPWHLILTLGRDETSEAKRFSPDIFVAVTSQTQAPGTVPKFHI